MTTFGVYVHVPFCAHRCDYCAFATYDDRDYLRDDYVDAVLREIAWEVEAGMQPATSVFFGGGTPSRLTPVQLVRILEAIPRTRDAEVTVECNPEDASLDRLLTYKSGGVTRMSYGVQSTQPAVLADLGRRHGTMAHEEVSRVTHDAGFSRGVLGRRTRDAEGSARLGLSTTAHQLLRTDARAGHSTRTGPGAPPRRGRHRRRLRPGG